MTDLLARPCDGCGKLLAGLPALAEMQHLPVSLLQYRFAEFSKKFPAMCPICDGELE